MVILFQEKERKNKWIGRSRVGERAYKILCPIHFIRINASYKEKDPWKREGQHQLTGRFNVWSSKSAMNMGRFPGPRLNTWLHVKANYGTSRTWNISVTEKRAWEYPSKTCNELALLFIVLYPSPDKMSWYLVLYLPQTAHTFPTDFFSIYGVPLMPWWALLYHS